MLLVDTSGVDDFIKELDAEWEAMQLHVRTVFRSWGLTILADIARLTPQWSGNLTANWAIDLNGEHTSAKDLGDPSVRDWGVPTGGIGVPPYSRGMDPAVGKAVDRSKNLPMPQLTDTLFIHNPVDYADQVESGTSTSGRSIRPINRVPDDETGKVAMIYHAYMKFSLTGDYFV